MASSTSSESFQPGLGSRNSSLGRSMPPSPNRVSVERDETGTTIVNRVLLGADATKDPLDYPLLWVIRNLTRAGDHIMFLGILHRVRTPMGYESQANLADFIGTNNKALEVEIHKTMERFEQKLRLLSDLCDREGVYLDITITGGTPLKLILVQEALKFKATHVVIDRNLRRDKRYYKDHLTCNLIAFSQNNQVELLRDNYGSCSPPHSRGPLQKLRAIATPTSNSLRSMLDSDSNTPSGRSTFSGENITSSGSLSFRSEEAERPSQDIMAKREPMAPIFSPESDSRSVDNSSSDSPSRENSFIDLYMLNSPEGGLPVWSFADEKKCEPACSTNDEPDKKASISLAPLPQIRTSRKLVPEEIPSVDTTPCSGSHHSVEMVKGSTSPLLRKPFPLRNELLKAGKQQSFEDVDSGKVPKKLLDGQQSAPLDRTDVFSSADRASREETSVLKHMTQAVQFAMPKVNNAGPVGMIDHILGKTLTHPPPLCSKCKMKSPQLGKSLNIYEYEDLKAATNNFSSENLIAEGGSSFVYEGTLQGGEIVAVKRLKFSGLQGGNRFSAEVEALSFAQHRNLVRLLGYCADFDEHILVYEYVCNGSLDRLLSSPLGIILDWPSRFKIAVGAARGLRYLHEECRVGCIVHRDLRPNNILLTHDFTAMVGDFGLAKLNTILDATGQTQVIGSLEYVAPEYLACGQVTAKTDVYAYGVVLLELITGRKSVDLLLPEGDISLTDWARRKLDSHQIHELVDQKLVDSLDMFELNRMVKVASTCIEMDPSRRLSMSQILRVLEGDFDLLWGATTRELSALENNGNESTPEHEGHQGEEPHHAAVDKVQMLHNTSQRVSSVPWSWRNWVKPS